jgi:AcrR family transcriptional regulator
MGQKKGLSEDSILKAAADLVESQGFENLYFRNLAAALGVKPPSLYHHIKDLGDLQVRIAYFALEQLEQGIRDRLVGKSRENAIREAAVGYRDFARKHPELYKAFSIIPQSDDPELKETAHSLQNTLSSILKPYHLKAEDEIHFIRFMRSSLHGFVSLETMGFFHHGSRIRKDVSFNEMVNMFLIVLKNFEKKGQR